MQKNALILSIAALLFAAYGCGGSGVSGPTDLDLHISCERTTLRAGDEAKMKVTIANKGENPVTLVLPGDGSNSRMRTPVVGWSVLVSGDPAAQHPTEVPLFNGSRCGNVNALKPEEVFVLEANKTQELGGWVGWPSFPRSGTYRVVFYYFNEPDLKWSGLPLGKHDPRTMQRVRRSARCKLISNELLIEVKP